MARTLVVFDFDKTIIDCDSDNWVVEQLGLADFFTHLLPSLPWNSLMDRVLMELYSRGKTVQDIEECLKHVPLYPSIISAIKSAHASRCDLKIVSDANVFFIETILKHHGLMNCFSEIITNPSYVDAQGRLRVSPYHDSKSSPHGCNVCPPNMCKGLIMERMRASVEGKTQIMYIGDGTPDFCAALKLKEGEFLMPRKGFPMWELIGKNEIAVKAIICEWSDWEELGAQMLNLISTIFFDKCNGRPDSSSVPIDCKFQTSSVSHNQKVLL